MSFRTALPFFALLAWVGCAAPTPTAPAAPAEEGPRDPGAGLLFKGSGFYTTDYRSDSYKAGAKSDSASGGGKSDSKKSDSSSGGSGGAKSSGSGNSSKD